MANTISGVNGNTNYYNTRINQNNKKSDSNAKANDTKKTANDSNNGGSNVQGGYYNDPKRIVNGVFEEKQLKWLDELKDNPINKRLVDNQTMGKDQFMHILLTQLANQNPLNPMEDKDFISQMAEFSSLESIQAMGKNFEGVAGTVNELRDIVSMPSESDVLLHASLAKLIADIQLIGKKLGVEFPTEETEGTENTGETEEVENDGENTEGSSETATEEVNTEINKDKAAKAYS